MNGPSCLFLYLRLFKRLPISPGRVPLWGLLNLQVSLYAYLILWGPWAALIRTLQRPLLLPRASKIRAARHALSLAPRSVAAGRVDSAPRPRGEAKAHGLPDTPWSAPQAVAGAGGARQPPRTAPRPEGRAWTAARPPSQPPFPADTAAGPFPREAPAGGTHLELRLGDLAAAVQVERGEGVPDGF